MAIFKNCEVWFAKLDPKRPSKKLTPKNPTWEIQLRTTDKNQKKEWEAGYMNVKAVREDPTDEESKILYYRTNLKKKSLKKEGDEMVPTGPVDVVDGKQNPIDPTTIGNGSIVNIRTFQHEYTFEGKKGMTNTLMGIQVIKHIVYVAKPMEEFDDAETETIIPEDEPAEGSARDADEF